MTTETRTPEQVEADEIRYAEQNRASAVFSRHNPTFIRNQKNAEAMSALIVAAKLDWTEENLQKLFDENKDKFELRAPYVPPKQEEQPEAQNIEPWADLTKFQIDAMSREEYGKNYKDPKFVAAVNRVLRGGR
jgi:hypothetical protein